MTKRYGLDLQQRYELKQKWKAVVEKERVERQKRLSRIRFATAQKSVEKLQIHVPSTKLGAQNNNNDKSY